MPLFGGGGLTGEGGGDGLGGLVPKRAPQGGDADHHHGACLSSAGGGGGGEGGETYRRGRGGGTRRSRAFRARGVAAGVSGGREGGGGAAEGGDDSQCSGRLQTWRAGEMYGVNRLSKKHLDIPCSHPLRNTQNFGPLDNFSHPVSLPFPSPTIQWAREKTMTARQTLASARSSQSLAHPPASLLSSV